MKMGYKTEFNWVLALSPQQGLPRKPEIGKNYLFEKQGERIYPLGWPIDLLDKDWKPHGKVIVEDVIKEEGKTRGSFRIVYIYDRKERRVLWNIIKKTLLEHKEE